MGRRRKGAPAIGDKNNLSNKKNMLQALASWKKVSGISGLQKILDYLVKAYDEPRFNISKANPDYFVCPGSKMRLMELCVLWY